MTTGPLVLRFPGKEYSPRAVKPLRVLAKDLIDVAGALCCGLLVLPLCLAIAVWIKLDSRGPVLFRQQRVGLDERPFLIYKFRTMRVTAEAERQALATRNEATGPLFKLTEDPRVTRAGRVLRSWSLDELPQFLNVLLGHMSLVGPRPLPVRDWRAFADRPEARHLVKPGITGPWQVSGRSGMGEYMLTLDLAYVRRWSFKRDLEILLRTVPAVLSRRGAH